MLVLVENTGDANNTSNKYNNIHWKHIPKWNRETEELRNGG